MPTPLNCYAMLRKFIIWLPVAANVKQEGSKPTTRPMLGMLISSNFGEGVPPWWTFGGIDIGGVRQDVSELLHAVYTKHLSICCGFASILNLNFGFPNLGERGHLWGWAFVVSDGASVTYSSHYKIPGCFLLWFCRRVSFNFLITPIFGEGVPSGVDDDNHDTAG